MRQTKAENFCLQILPQLLVEASGCHFQGFGDPRLFEGLQIVEQSGQ